jgi:hypothetical protein
MSNSQDSKTVRTALQDEQMGAVMAEQTAMLRTVLERLDELVQLLTPKPSEGPTLDELIGGLVTLVSDQTVLLKRIDARTAVLVEPHLCPTTTPHGSDAGANGKGARE